MSGRIAAFFDFDQTLLIRDSAEVGIRYLYELGEIPLSLVLKIWAASKLYKLDIVSPEAMAHLCMRFYKGRDLAFFAAGSEEFYRDYLKPLLNPAALGSLEEHRRAGHLLVILSASVRYMLEPAKNDLGFDELLCTDLELDERGLLTGRPRGFVQLGEHKARAMRALAAERDLDLAASYAYSDHHSDVPMLEAVGHAVAVNPNARLSRIARRRAWPII